MKKETFATFYRYFCDKGEKDKFVNMTNGVTRRRWIHCANRPLSDIYSKHLGSQKWLTNMELLKGLQKKKGTTLPCRRSGWPRSARPR